MGFCPFFFRGNKFNIMLNRRSDKMELLRIAEAVATEKAIDKEIIISSMEKAIQKAAKTRFGGDNEIRATIDRLSGEINLKQLIKLKLTEKIERQNVLLVMKKEHISMLLVPQLGLFLKLVKELRKNTWELYLNES